jgi:hypothetical protein
MGAAVTASLLFLSTPAWAPKVRISDLSDVTFSQLDPTFDVRNSQEVCVFADGDHRYNITARGSGTSSAFTLSAGGGFPLLAYEVEWNGLPGQQTGTQLSPGIAQGGFTTNGTDQTCKQSAKEGQSLIIVLRSNALAAAATDVQYSGTLTLTVIPE